LSKINEQQFLELYDKNVSKIYRYIYFRVGVQELAQDLTSEVFLKSWQRLNQSGAKAVENPRAFFYQIARNLLVDFYRQKDKSPIALDEIADKTVADKTGLWEQTITSLNMDEVTKALSLLKEEYREIIIWRYLDEMEIKEIAQILNKREGTVRTLLSRSLASLKEILGKPAKISEKISVREVEIIVEKEGA
jgi:RNA polymerase sigma-70 factor (ECF subfamily)